MADPESGPSDSASRRRAAPRQRSQARNHVLGIVGIVILCVLAALWFSDTLRIPTAGPSLAAGVETTGGGEQTGSGTPVHPTDAPRRALNPLEPLRLWIGGDSLAGALGPSLGQMTAATGVVQPQYDSRVGSGLSSVGDMNWPRHAMEQLALLKPEAIVFMIGTNDAVVYDDSQAAEYATLTEQMMRLLVGTGREVYWVDAPVMRDKDLEANVLKINAIQREVAAKIPQVTFVDAHTLFADDRGEYQSSLPDATGKTVVMRAGDGIHLTGAGGDRLAAEIFNLLDHRWHILKQAVPGMPKKVLVTRGSTQVSGSGAGSSRGSGSSRSGSNGSSSYGSNGSSNRYGTSQTTTATQPTTASTQTSQTTQGTTATTSSTPSTTPTSTPGGG